MSSAGEDQCSQTSASAPSSSTIRVRQPSAPLLRSNGTSIWIGSATRTPRGTWTSTPSRQPDSLRATKKSSIGTSEPRCSRTRSSWEAVASASGRTVTPSGTAPISASASTAS